MLSEETYAAMLLDQMPPFDPAAPAREVRVTLNSDLLRILAEMGMDLSSCCERGLTEQLRRLLYERWRDERRREATGDQSSW